MPIYQPAHAKPNTNRTLQIGICRLGTVKAGCRSPPFPIRPISPRISMSISLMQPPHFLHASEAYFQTSYQPDYHVPNNPHPRKIKYINNLRISSKQHRRADGVLKLSSYNIFSHLFRFMDKSAYRFQRYKQNPSLLLTINRFFHYTKTGHSPIITLNPIQVNRDSAQSIIRQHGKTPVRRRRLRIFRFFFACCLILAAFKFIRSNGGTVRLLFYGYGLNIIYHQRIWIWRRSWCDLSKRPWTRWIA